MNFILENAELIKSILIIIGYFFLFYLLGYSFFMVLSVIVGSNNLYTKKRQSVFKNTIVKNYYVPISVIVPAHNEEVTVIDTVNSLLSLDYKSYEIIVVDDGSTDDTAKLLIEHFNLKPIKRSIRVQIDCKPVKEVYESHAYKVPIILVSKENGGKSDALNMGINVSNYPYSLCIDADSQLQYDTLTHIASSVLEQDNVIAVGGVIRPSNDSIIKNAKVAEYNMPKNLLASMQVLEYDRTFLSSRILFDSYNGTLIISGALGLFKKDVVIAAGGYEVGNIGEDMELILKLHEFCQSNKVDYVIHYAPDAVCWTQVPENLSDLCKQRKRWHIGLFESMRLHRALFANVKFGPVSLISYLYYLIYELLSPVIEIIGIITTLLSWYLGILNTRFMVMFFLLYALFNAIITLTAFFTRVQTIDLKITFKDAVKTILLSFFEITILRFVMFGVRLLALFGYRKNKGKWGKLKRYKQNVEA